MNSLRSTEQVVVSQTGQQVRDAMKNASKRTVAGVTLTYEGSIPVLTISSKSAKEAGHAQGYLLAEPINLVIQTITSAILSTFSLPVAWAEASKLLDDELLDSVWAKIPANSQQELDGMIDGFNKRLKEGAFKGSPLSRKEVVLFHMLPDKQHFDLVEAIGGKFSQLFGCTTVVGGDKAAGYVFGRNLDWPSYGCLAEASMIVRRTSYETGKRTLEVGLAGFVGILTGMNEDGLAVAMNVCDGKTEKVLGMPAAFYNRTVLESCSSASKVEEYIKKSSPLGPYHLTVVDQAEAKVFHLMQGAKNSHLSRLKQEGQILEATNCRYKPAKKGECLPQKDEYQSSERRAELAKHFKAKVADVEAALKLPTLNMAETLHSIVMLPKEKKMKVAVGNGHAASNPFVTVEL